MDVNINDKSSLKRDKMSMYYGVALAEMWADLYTWNTSAKKVNLENFSFDKYKANWRWTNVQCIISETKWKWYDTLFIITDEQSSFSMQSSDIKNIIVWNVADYNHSLLPSYEKWYTYITGFNDAQFELAQDLRDLDGLVKSIKDLDILHVNAENE
jgi:hypothetical protein